MSYLKSSQTRETLLKTTASLLRSKGYAAMGLSDIVKKSGIPKGSLYYHFPAGKEELAAAAVRFAGKAMLASLSRLIEKTGNPIAGLQAFFNYYILQLDESGYRDGCPLATVALETASGVPLVQKACAGAFSDYGKLLAGQLVHCGAAPEKADAWATQIISSVEGALLLAKAQNDTNPLIVMRDQLTEQLTLSLPSLTSMAEQK
ncbi:MAG: TetR/AcrR family transcriptional regulator [Sneathiella sp.]